MGEFTTIAETTEIPPGQAKCIEIADRKVAVFNVGGVYYAIDDTCTHRGGPLSEGEVEGTQVTCPWHGAMFNLMSGEVLGPPAPSGVRGYTVHVEGNEVKIEIPS